MAAGATAELMASVFPLGRVLLPQESGEQKGTACVLAAG